MNVDFGFREVTFGGVPETIVTTEAWTDGRIREVLGREKGIVTLGFGSQAPGQTTQLRRLGLENLIVCQRESHSEPGEDETRWEKAIRYGWKPNVNLFSSPEEAMPRGTMHLYLVSDGGQVKMWPNVRKYLKPGDALDFAHGFGYVFNDITGIVPPKNIDLFLNAPKGTGSTVEKGAVNKSYDIGQNFTGRALERCLALGMGIGKGIMFKTTFPNEVYSDLFGERFFLLGGKWAIAQVSYERKRRLGFNPHESFIDTSEQITQVILPFIRERGFEGLYLRAQSEGQLGTVLQYENAVRQAAVPFLKELYQSVKDGTEARKAVEYNTQPDYETKLKARLRAIDSTEMWEAGKTVRTYAPDRTYQGKITNWQVVGMLLGAMKAQYQFLIDHGHSASEAINETPEESVTSLNPLYAENGIAHLLGHCSTTAQVGAEEWGPRLMEVLRPVLSKLRESYGNEINTNLILAQTTKPKMEDVYRDNMRFRPTTRAA
ncbi:ketol-acid reductoisomerase [Candidatus Woesearchaeota archaeon]|nr:ketol-acid reductoisomerase [Candidatus Woesearchaeota archaeon]